MRFSKSRERDGGGGEIVTSFFVTLTETLLFGGNFRGKHRKQPKSLCVNNCGFDKTNGINDSMTECESKKEWGEI